MNITKIKQSCPPNKTVTNSNIQKFDKVLHIGLIVEEGMKNYLRTGQMQKKIKPFKSDGCSVWPDGDWKDCCIEHDKEYWLGGTRTERLKSDKQLKRCVAAKGHPIIARLMYAGVRFGGWPWFPVPWRWGFGYKYPSGYKEKKINNVKFPPLDN